jgi:hypothetical protein
MSYVDDERFDGLYLNVAQQTRGIEPLLDTVFSFLRRKSDFFAGPPGTTGTDAGTDAAIQKVHDVLNKHADIYRAEQTKKAAAAKKKKDAAEAKNKKTAAAVKKVVKEEEVLEIGADGGFDVSDSSPTVEEAEPVKKEPPVAAAAPKKEEAAAPKDDDEEEKPRGPPPVGNGGTVEGKYVWTQTLEELNLTVPLPDNTRGRDLNVTIAKKQLKVGLKSAPKGEWIINGPLPKTIICDDSFWTIEDGNRLVMNLQKSNGMEWWDCVVTGDPTIDVKLIQPENSNLADLDGETRQTVEKMMFDQRQKAMGKPTSEEQNKLDMLDKFKKAHPEMDFSNAKFT